VLASPQIDKLL